METSQALGERTLRARHRREERGPLDSLGRVKALTEKRDVQVSEPLVSASWLIGSVTKDRTR